MVILYVGALIAELAGLVLAAHGFRRTWLEFRNPDEEFFGSVTRPVKITTRKAYARVRKFLGKPIPPRTVHVTGVSSLSLVATASATVTWAPLPSLHQDSDAFIKALDSRLNQLNDRLQNAEKRIRDDAEAAAARHEETAQAIGEARDEARGQVRTVTVGGLREQVIGWSLIVAGVVTAGVGDIIQAL
jgi:hypothetical protein